MMTEVRVYIPPGDEDYTGYSTFVTSGTSTSDLGSFYLPQEEALLSHAPAVQEQAEEDTAERLEFYEK